MVWPSALHSIARPLQLSGGRQIGRGFAPGQQPLPLRKPLPRSSRSSSHYHYQAVVEVVLGSGHYQDVELLLLSTGHQPLPAAASTLMHDTCPAQTEAHSPHVISFALFTTCYLFWFYSLHAMSPT